MHNLYEFSQQDPRYGANLYNVMASLKKHEAISADIQSRNDRFKEIEKIMAQLERENYHEKATVQKQGAELLIKWKKLMDLLEEHQTKLESRLCWICLRKGSLKLKIVTPSSLLIQFQKYHQSIMNPIKQQW